MNFLCEIVKMTQFDSCAILAICCLQQLCEIVVCILEKVSAQIFRIPIPRMRTTRSTFWHDVNAHRAGKNDLRLARRTSPRLMRMLWNIQMATLGDCQQVNVYI